MILALDAGTTAVKAVLLLPAPNGWQVVARAAASVAAPTVGGALPHNAVEQDPEAWFDAAISAAREVVAAVGSDATRLVAVALSGLMQSVILCDAACRALRPALLYSDARATAEASAVEEVVGRASLLAETANFKGAASVLPKLLWLHKHEPDTLDVAKHVLLGAHDYLFARLSGGSCPVTDFTNASTTGLLQAHSPQWHTGLLSTMAISSVASKLPRLASGAQALAPLSAASVALLGLPESCVGAGIQVCHGAGDLGTTTIGALAPLGGRGAYCYLGTSGWAACASRGEVLDAPRAFGVRHPEAGASIAAAPMTTAGAHFAWLCQLLFPSLPEADAFAQLDAEAGNAAVDAGGVLFLPYLGGERCPFEDPNARACWIGMHASTQRVDLCQAVILGVCFALKSLLMLLPASGGGIGGRAGGGDETGGGIPSGGGMGGNGALVIVGGAARSKALRQTLADVLQREILVPDHPQDVGALGAATLAAKALGIGVGEHGGMHGERSVPRAERSGALATMFEAFVAAHPALDGTFACLARV